MTLSSMCEPLLRAYELAASHCSVAPVLPNERITQHCCAAGFQFGLCPLWVKSRNRGTDITEFATGYPGYNSLVPKSAGSAADATADAAMTELEPNNRRRLISTLPTGDEALEFLSDFSSLIVFSGVVRQFRASNGDGCRAAIDDRSSAGIFDLI
jgi:hypothetical protein